MDSAEDSYAPVAQEQVECNEHSNKRIDTPDAQHIHFHESYFNWFDDYLAPADSQFLQRYWHTCTVYEHLRHCESGRAR